MDHDLTSEEVVVQDSPDLQDNPVHRMVRASENIHDFRENFQAYFKQFLGDTDALQDTNSDGLTPSALARVLGKDDFADLLDMYSPTHQHQASL